MKKRSNDDSDRVSHQKVKVQKENESDIGSDRDSELEDEPKKQKVQPDNKQNHLTKKSLSKTSRSLNQQNKASKSKKIPKVDPDDIDNDINDLDTMINSSTVCRKIRIYPTSNQSSFSNKCFGTSRFIYNKALRKYIFSICFDLFNSLKN
jgi:hypothetical protein